MKDLKKLMNPKYIEVHGLFMPRGGIAIHPFANWGDRGYGDLANQRRRDVLAKDWNMYPAGE